MVSINVTHKILLMSSMFLSGTLNATTIEFIEDAYAQQAPQEIVTIVEQIAQQIGYKDTYQIVVPKKAGMQINPWNQFAACGINSQNAYPFIMINPEWFMAMPQDEQLFLLGRYFLLFKYGMASMNMKIFPYTWILFIIALLVGLTIALGKTRLAHYNRGIRLLMAYVILIVCHFTFLSKTQEYIMRYLGKRYDMHLNNMVIEITGNKHAAVKALKHFDASIKQEYHKGEIFWQPYADLFDGYASELEKQV